MGRRVQLSPVGNFGDQPWGDRVPMPPLDSGWVDRYQLHKSLPGYPQTSLNATPQTGSVLQVPGIKPNPITPYTTGMDSGYTSYERPRNLYRSDYAEPVETFHNNGNDMWDDIMEDRVSLLLAVIVALLFLNVLLLFFLFLQK